MRTMKEELSISESKTSHSSQKLGPPPLPPSRSTESVRTKASNDIFLGLKVRSSTGSLEPTNAHRALQSLSNSKNKPGQYEFRVLSEGKLDYTKILGQIGNETFEQFPWSHCQWEKDCKIYEEERDSRKKELLQRVEGRENLVKELQFEVSRLKADLKKLLSRNIELESHNKLLAENLSASKAKISALENQEQMTLHEHKIKPSEFRDAQRLVEDKLSNFVRKKVVPKEEDKTSISISSTWTSELKSIEFQSKNSMIEQPVDYYLTKKNLPPSPPPPPPLPPRPPPPPPTSHKVRCSRNPNQKAERVAELYNSLAKRDKSNSRSTTINDIHNSIVDEIQNRSTHLLAIKTDVETKGNLIKLLIGRVQSAAFDDMEDVLSFVDWLDKELSVLSDERAVLKHFNWPERKADALREAAVEYRDLKQLQFEASSFVDDVSVPCEAMLKKITCLVDKLEKGIQRLIKLRDATMLSLKNCSIPTDWMLDSGMVSKIRIASVNLARVNMKRISMELKSARLLEKESMHEALLFHGLRLAYRTHQFAGGFDSETMQAFEELTKQAQLRRRDEPYRFSPNLQS
ncbi:Protein CHUP1, chloroplastic [Apostasia shenzhenica]|uniref:Protein CHUP1, chloroplastic n=1 Tax=Apostasia shenzhenica TaxID=1088818 RepID=A0A2I0AGN9_9ASPA|nr:Protein CHUP1, chloroplastic [Apostasia shenzhenica]